MIFQIVQNSGRILKERARYTLTVFLAPFHNAVMKQRFYIYQRGGTYYMQDSRTGKQQSLGTQDKQAALRLLEVKRQTVADPGFNQFILKTCLTTQDPLLPKRTWAT